MFIKKKMFMKVAFASGLSLVETSCKGCDRFDEYPKGKEHKMCAGE